MLQRLSPMFSTLPLWLALAATGCSDDAGRGPGGDVQDEEAVPVQLGEPESSGDPLDIVEAEVIGNDLRLVVQHGGGCEEHEYDLFWNGRLLETFPEQARLQLVHDANGDACEAFLTRELRFDLSAIREAHGGEEGRIILSLDGAEDELELVWPTEGSETPEVQVGEPPRESDGLTIQDASIDGERLTIQVRYSGGCEDHEFGLFWDGLIIETLPGSVDLVLFHDANNDLCEALKGETLVFDLSPLGGGPLRVHLDGFDDVLDLE